MSYLGIHRSDQDLRELLVKYRETGKTRYLNPLLDTIIDYLLGQMKYRFPNLSDANIEDLVGDKILNILERDLLLEATKDDKKIRNWFFTVTYNHIRDSFKKKNIIDIGLDIKNDKEFVELEHDIRVLKEKWEDELIDCINKLTHQGQKECIRLFHLEGQSYEEIVRRLAFEDKKVKSYLQNGRRMLKKCMINKGYER